ncbi:unnamed protein product [Amaranthus hypochondriacus]
MSLPIGTVIRLLKVKRMVGCLGTLYKSIQTLNNDYFQPNLKKDTILNPTTRTVNVPLLSLNDVQTDNNNKVSLYRCDYYGRDRCDRYTDCLGTVCPRCDLEMSTLLTYVESAGLKKCCSTGSDGGYVKGLVNYMVMDDLVVKPMSTISGITLMNKFCVTDLSDLVEKEVQVGIQEVIAIFKPSMETSAVLTNVFIS